MIQAHPVSPSRAVWIPISHPCTPRWKLPTRREDRPNPIIVSIVDRHLSLPHNPESLGDTSITTTTTTTIRVITRTTIDNSNIRITNRTTITTITTIGTIITDSLTITISIIIIIIMLSMLMDFHRIWRMGSRLLWGGSPNPGIEVSPTTIITITITATPITTSTTTRTTITTTITIEISTLSQMVRDRVI